jgi:hypothetical protein
MLFVVKINVIMLNVIKLNVVMLNVIMLNVVMLSVVTPSKMFPSDACVVAIWSSPMMTTKNYKSFGSVFLATAHNKLACLRL